MNILLILTDQQRYDSVGFNGNRFCQTPNLDRLAASGSNFQRAYTPIALCSPARASLFTGQLPHRHGIIRNTDCLAPGARRLPSDMPTLPLLLREQGYACHLEGKWHAGEQSPAESGFEGLQTEGYGSALVTPEYAEHLERLGLDVPQVDYRGVGWQHNLGLAGISSGPVEASVPYFLADRCMKHLDEYAEHPTPFFLTSCFWGPHAPYVPCEPYASMVDPSDLPPWGNFVDDFTGKPSIYRRYQESFLGEDGELRTWEECAEWAALNYGFVTQIDEQIGRIIDRLDQLNLADNTAIIFSTDHGDLLGAHGGLHDKHSLMVDELYRIPLIIRLPGQAPQVIEDPVSLMDLFSTILDLADHSVTPSDGSSLLPVMRGEEARDQVVASAYGNHFYYETRMIVARGFKYIFHPSDIDELYDLDADPWEMNNLIDETEQAARLRELRKRLRDWSSGSNDPLYQTLENLHGDRSACGVEQARAYRTR